MMDEKQVLNLARRAHAQLEAITPAQEKAEWQTAFQADSKAAEASGKTFTLGCTGPALERHEQLWAEKRAHLRGIVDTLNWILGRNELVKGWPPYLAEVK